MLKILEYFGAKGERKKRKRGEEKEENADKSAHEIKRKLSFNGEESKEINNKYKK